MYIHKDFSVYIFFDEKNEFELYFFWKSNKPRDEKKQFLQQTCFSTLVRQIFAWFYFREWIFRWFRVDIFSRIIITVIFRVDIFSRILGKGRKYILRKSQNFIKLLYAPKYTLWVHWKNVFNIRDFLYP